MAVDDCNADGQANALFTSLTADAPTPPTIDFTDIKFNFDPDIDSDLYSAVSTINLDQLTEVDLQGTGVLDTLMRAMDQHIQREYDKNRITGAEYAKTYTEVTTAVLGQSVAFLLQKDQAKWAAITAQMQARIMEIQATEALINLEKTKVETQQAIFEMQNSGAQYALTKMQIANADATYCLTKAQTGSENYRLSNLLPAEFNIQEFQRSHILASEYAANQVTATRILPAEAAIKEYEHRIIQPLNSGIQEFQLNQMLPISLSKEQHLLNFQMPAQTNLINEQVEVQRSQTLETRTDDLTPISGVIGRQKDLLDRQSALTLEQTEAERSKTLDTRLDGSTIVEGLNGKQKDLYDQQIDSFIKDAKQKAAKMYLDGWITQKTLDENFSIPTQLTTPEINIVLQSLRTANSL